MDNQFRKLVQQFLIFNWNFVMVHVKVVGLPKVSGTLSNSEVRVRVSPDVWLTEPVRFGSKSDFGPTVGKFDVKTSFTCPKLEYFFEIWFLLKIEIFFAV